MEQTISFIVQETVLPLPDNHSPIIDVQNKGVCLPVHEVTIILFLVLRSAIKTGLYASYNGCPVKFQVHQLSLFLRRYRPNLHVMCSTSVLFIGTYRMFDSPIETFVIKLSACCGVFMSRLYLLAITTKFLFFLSSNVR